MRTIAPSTPCPYCTTPLGEELVHECDECGVPHHADCWADNGGCAVALCTAGPKGSDPALRPPVTARRVLVVELDEDEAAGASGALPDDSAPDDVDAFDQRQLVLALLTVAGGLLLVLLVAVVVFS
jgi:hypothetical protein